MKRIISALLSATLLAGVAAMPAAAEETYSLGDVTMDGVVDVADVIDVLVHYTRVDILGTESELTEQQIALANVDFALDGNIDIDSYDALCVMWYYIYTMLTEEPVATETFFADPHTYLAELNESDFTAAGQQAYEDGQEYTGGSHDVE